MPNFLSKFWEFSKQEFPKSIRGRELGQPEGYPSWQSIMGATVLPMLNAAGLRESGMPMPARSGSEAVLSIALAEAGNPILWVDRHFLSNLLKTDVPSDISIADLVWPFPAMTFVLPSNTIAHKHRGDCSWMSIGRIGGDNICPFTGDTIRLRSSSLFVYSAPWEVDFPPLFSFGLPDDPTIKPFEKLPVGKPQMVDFSLPAPFVADGGITEEDNNLTEVLTQLALKLVLALTANPEYLAPLSPKKRFVRRGALVEQEIPRWIGKDSEIQTDSNIEMDSDIEFEWTTGRFEYERDQPGPRRKIVWHRPFLTPKS